MALFLEEQIVDLGVSGPEAHLLSYVDTYGPCPIGELVRVFGYKKTTMTSMLDRLELRKLVRRAINSEDRRSFLVTATKAGGRLGEKARESVLAFDDEVLRRVSERDWSGFQVVLKMIAEVTEIDVREEKKKKRPTLAARRS